MPLSHAQFIHVMHLAAQSLGGWAAVEGCKGVGGAQGDTMYGTMSDAFVERFIQRTRLGKDDSFFDAGSGVGQVVMQVALTVRCRVSGVEIGRERFEMARRLRGAVFAVLEASGMDEDNVRLARDKLYRDRDNRDPLVCDNMRNFFPTLGNHTHIFFNNFGKWFDDRDGLAGINTDICPVLGEHMRPGAHFVVLRELPGLSQAVVQVDGAGYVSLDRYSNPPTDASWRSSPFDAWHYINANMSTVGLWWRCSRCNDNCKVGESCSGKCANGRITRPVKNG